MKKLIKDRNRSYISPPITDRKIFGIVSILCVFVISFIVATVLISSLMRNSSSETSHFIDSGSDITTASEILTPSNNDEHELSRQRMGEPLYEVVSVIDGDTIKIDYDGSIVPVRLIGVNTPETVDPRKMVECFGIESSSYLNNILTNRRVSIESDSTQSDRDKYNRLLRYVYLNGEDVGYKIIANGYGYEYTYYAPYLKQAEYKAAEIEAASHERGLWAPGACSD